MQLTFVDVRQTSGRQIFTSAVQFYDLPLLIVGPTAESLEGVLTALVEWFGVEEAIIFRGDWPPNLHSLKVH
jgi:hypothetical protein